jgi:hypothetical protein
MTTTTLDLPVVDRKGLRSFALQVGITIALLFGALLPWLFGFDWPVWPWVLGGALVLWGLIAPSTLRLVHRGWMGLAVILHKVMSPIILGVVFFLVVSPMALVMRIAGRDPMRRALRADEKSYRVGSEPLRADNLERPF